MNGPRLVHEFVKYWLLGMLPSQLWRLHPIKHDVPWIVHYWLPKKRRQRNRRGRARS